MRSIAMVVAGVVLAGAAIEADQRGRTPQKKPAPPAANKIEQAKVQCPETLGNGINTTASYCFVLAGRDPAEGVVITVPPHRGEATIIFNLHNRHTYSEEDVKRGRAFARYSAVIGALTMTGELLGRGAVQTEFRSARDLFERIGGGAGPGGVKAVAPLGNETIYIDVPEKVSQVSLLGEVFEALTNAGRETATPGRPVAIVSNIRVEYRPLK